MAVVRNQILQLVPQRVAKLVSTLQEQLWQERKDVPVVGGPVNQSFIALDAAKSQRMKPVKPGEYFGPANGGWQQRWFKVEIPQAKRDQKGKRCLFWDCRGETTVYKDGAPWAGLDIGHKYCVIPDSACTLWLDCGTYQSAIWLQGPKPDAYGLQFDGAWIACRNDPVWDAYWDLAVLRQVIEKILKDAHWEGFGFLQRPPMEKLPPLGRMMLVELDDCCNAWDTHGVEALCKALRATYAKFPAEYWQPYASTVGQSHLDLVWLWPERVTHRKGIHTFATALRLLDRYPEFKFMMSQPAIYRVVQQQAPILYKQVIDKIRQGRWEATGGAEVEFDNLIPCGEALARSLVLGQQKFKQIRSGTHSKILWLPDVFGYANCLPQIISLAGIPYFFTTKMSWSALNTFPYDAFVWRSPDGTEVLSYLAFRWFGNCDAPDMIDAAATYRQAGVFNEMIAPAGHGDGGGGPGEEFCERERRLANLAGVPKARWVNAEGFFDRLNTERSRLPVYEGELYLEYHRGCYTTQGRFKQAYRAAERAMQVREAVRVAGGQGQLDQADWLRVCFAQFHDAIPGSSIGLVYQELTDELNQITQKNLTAASDELGSGADTIVFNPCAIDRNTVIELDKSTASAVAKKGAAVQETSSRAIALAHVPALGSVALSKAQGLASKPARPWTVTSTSIDSGLVCAEFDKKSNLVKLTVDGKQLRITGLGQFTIHPDLPSNFDAWDIDNYSTRLADPVSGDSSLSIIEKGPVRARLRGVIRCGKKSKITVDYILEAQCPFLKIEATIDWQEDHTLLRYRLPTGYQGSQARFGCPYGSILRPQKPSHFIYEGMWEVPGSRWAAVTEEDGVDGLSIITQAKYGFSCRDGEIGLSLLRSPTDPDEKADRGTHTICWAIGGFSRHTTDTHISTPAWADAMYTPVVQGHGKSATPPFILSDLGSLVPAWVLPAQSGKGFVIRLHETMGERGTATLTLANEAKSVCLVNFLEDKIAPIDKVKAREYAIEYSPYKILGILVKY
jgi:alpha-mannosidase